jgi:hypothetical protein
MTQTVIFNINDSRLTEAERRQLLQLSTDLQRRQQEQQARDLRKLGEAHHRVDRGDL